MADRGIFVSVLPRLELASLAAVVTQMKSVLGGAGKDISRSFTEPQKALRALEDEMIASSNRSANAQIRAAKLAGDARVAEAKRGAEAEAGLAKASEDRTAKELAAINVVSTARAKASQAGTEAEQASSKAARATDEHAAAMANAGAGALTLSSGLNTLGKVGFGALAVTIAGTAHEAGDFQAQMTKLTASAGESSMNIKAVSDGILQMAGQVGYSTKQLSDGMYLVEKAGYRGADGLTVLRSAAQLAKAENADLTEVINGLTTSVHDFNLTPAQSADTASKINVAVGAAKTNLQQYTAALHSIEPVASSAGISLEDTYGSLAMGTQSGSSPEQFADNMAGAVRSLSNPNQVQRDAMAKLGINADDVSQKLGQRGLAGSMQYLSETIKSQMNPAQQVVVDDMYKNAQATEDAKKMLDAMSPAARQVADGFQQGSVSRKEYMAAIKASNAEDSTQLQQFGQLVLKLDGYGQNLKKNQSTVETYQRALKEVTGTQEALTVALQLTGDHTKPVNDLIAQLTATTREHDGTVKGFNETQQTMNAKLADAKAAFGAAATEIGTNFLPILTAAIQAGAGFGQFLAENTTLTNVFLGALVALGGGWATVKAGLMARDVWLFLETSINTVAARFATIGPAAATAATEVEAAAAAEVTAEDSVSTAASGASVAVANVGRSAMTGLSAIAATYLGYDSLQNSVPWVKDHNGLLAALSAVNPLADLLGPGAHADTTSAGDAAQSKLDSAIQQRQQQQSVVDEVNRRLAASGVGPNAPKHSLLAPDASAAPTGPASAPPTGVGSAAGSGAPTGHRNDPLYVSPSEAGQFTAGKGVGDTYDPFQAAGQGGFTLPNIARLLGTWAANEALGNPYGKLQAEKRGADPSSPLYVSDVSNTSGGGWVQDLTRRARSQLGQQSPGTTNQTQDQVATAIIQEGMKRGLNREQIIAGLDVAKLESNYGANPLSHVQQNQSGTIVQGIFQQDTGYHGDHNEPHNAAGQFFDRFIQRGGLNTDPYTGAVKVQVGQYGGGYVQGQNQGGLYDRLAPGAAAGLHPGAGPTANPLQDLLGQYLPGGGQGPIFKRSPGDGGNTDPFAQHPNPQTGGNGMPGPLSRLNQPGMPGASAGMSGPQVPARQAHQDSSKQGTTNSSGFGIGGGMIGAAESAASMGIGAAAGGAGALGAAAGGGGGGKGGDVAMAEANRAVGFLGQLAGIGAEGLLETFSLNDSPIADPSKSLFGKIAFGMAGAHPSGNNSAGSAGGAGISPGQAGAQSAPPIDPSKVQGQQGDQNNSTQNTGIHVNGDLNIGGQDPQGSARALMQEQNRGLMSMWGGNG